MTLTPWPILNQTLHMHHSRGPASSGLRANRCDNDADSVAHLAPDFAHVSLKGASFKWTAGSSGSPPPGSPEHLSLIPVPCFSKFSLRRLCLQQKCRETEVATAEELLTKTGTNPQCALVGAFTLHGVCVEMTCVQTGSQF